MVTTLTNPTAETNDGLDSQGNAGYHLMSIVPTYFDLAQRVEHLKSLERMLDRDFSKARREYQAVQTAISLTQMTEAMTPLTRATARRGPN